MDNPSLINSPRGDLNSAARQLTADLTKADLSGAKYLRAEDLIKALNWRNANLDSSLRKQAEVLADSLISLK